MQTQKYKKKAGRHLEPVPSQHGEHMIMLSITKKKKETVDDEYMRDLKTPDCSSSDDESF